MASESSEASMSAMPAAAIDELREIATRLGARRTGNIELHEVETIIEQVVATAEMITARSRCIDAAGLRSAGLRP